MYVAVSVLLPISVPTSRYGICITSRYLTFKFWLYLVGIWPEYSFMNIVTTVPKYITYEYDSVRNWKGIRK